MSVNLGKVSIVIVTYKGDDLTRNCLDSLAMTCGNTSQIVVVDNSPSAETRNIVSRYPNALYVASPGNPGFAGGNNRAIPYCDRPYILLLNNDTVVHTGDSISKLVEFLDENPKCGAVQGSMRNGGPRGEIFPCGSFLTPFGFMVYPGGRNLPKVDTSKPFRCFSGIGAFLMFRRRVLEDVGGFLFRAHFWSYYEETDFCHRVWLSGHEVWYVPTAPITHIGGQTSGMFGRVGIMVRYLRNQFFSLAANLKPASAAAVLPLFACTLLAHGIASVLRGNAAQLRANLGVFAKVASCRKRILAARRTVAKIRKTSDISVFRKTMRLPSLGYLLRAGR